MLPPTPENTPISNFPVLHNSNAPSTILNGDTLSKRPIQKFQNHPTIRESRPESESTKRKTLEMSIFDQEKDEKYGYIRFIDFPVPETTLYTGSNLGGAFCLPYKKYFKRKVLDFKVDLVLIPQKSKIKETTNGKVPTKKFRNRYQKISQKPVTEMPIDQQLQDNTQSQKVLLYTWYPKTPIRESESLPMRISFFPIVNNFYYHPQLNTGVYLSENPERKLLEVCFDIFAILPKVPNGYYSLGYQLSILPKMIRAPNLIKIYNTDFVPLTPAQLDIVKEQKEEKPFQRDYYQGLDSPFFIKTEQMNYNFHTRELFPIRFNVSFDSFRFAENTFKILVTFSPFNAPDLVSELLDAKLRLAYITVYFTDDGVTKIQYEKKCNHPEIKPIYGERYKHDLTGFQFTLWQETSFVFRQAPYLMIQVEDFDSNIYHRIFREVTWSIHDLDMNKQRLDVFDYEQHKIRPRWAETVLNFKEKEEYFIYIPNEKAYRDVTSSSSALQQVRCSLGQIKFDVELIAISNSLSKDLVCWSKQMPFFYYQDSGLISPLRLGKEDFGECNNLWLPSIRTFYFKISSYSLHEKTQFDPEFAPIREFVLRTKTFRVISSDLNLEYDENLSEVIKITTPHTKDIRHGDWRMTLPVTIANKLHHPQLNIPLKPWHIKNLRKIKSEPEISKNESKQPLIKSSLSLEANK